MTANDETIVRTYHHDQQGPDEGSILGVPNNDITFGAWKALAPWQRVSVDASPLFKIASGAGKLAPKEEQPKEPEADPATTTTNEPAEKEA